MRSSIATSRSTRQASPSETIGVGEGFDVQLFDRANLKSANTRFVLAGIVNRMDRAYVSEESCGEIRLIYRLARFETGRNTATRLPMTFNLVMKARDARQTDATASRSPAPRSRGAGWTMAIGKG